MDENVVRFILHLDHTAISDERLNKLTLSLKKELTQISPAIIQTESPPLAPEHAMSVEALTLGAITLAVLPSMMPAVIDYLKEWRLRNANRMISITIKQGDQEIVTSFPEDMSPENLQSLIKTISKSLPKPKKE